MWFALLVLSMLAAAVHLRARRTTSRAAPAEIFLVYLLAGYCGFAQILRAVAILVKGAPFMAHVKFTPGDPAVLWLAFFSLGCGVIGAMSIWKRGDFLLGPVVAWSIFFVGVTFAHLRMDEWHGLSNSWLGVVWAFATHTLIAVLLVVFYVASVRRTPEPSIRHGVPAV
jgi:hypothetical protein